MKTIKVPKAEKLPSGNWRCRVRIKDLGVDESIVRKTKQEAERVALAIKQGFMEAVSKSDTVTVSECIDDYIEARRVRLSPATVRGYKQIKELRFPALMSANVNLLTDSTCQQAINQEKKNGLSPKSIKNAWALVASAVKEKTGKVYNVHLPVVVQDEHPWLDPDEVFVFIEKIRDEPLEPAALLALHGLRRSEIAPLTWRDLDLAHEIIPVRGAAVLNEDGELVKKPENKNRSSRRNVPIMIPRLLELAREHEGEDGVIMPGNINSLYAFVNRVCKENDLPQVGVHGLRHSFASLAYAKKVPGKIVMEICGWADDQTMRKIYTHISQKEIAAAAAEISMIFKQRGHFRGHFRVQE